ncbi:MAG: hypothetical protein M5U23_13380 [Acidimicrobiia bacterium]|nr:hypothetical protein [Acidimicrobiia bacterium]
MTTPEAITRRETTGSALLWIGVLTGPVAWSIQLGVDWFIAEVLACSPGTTTTGQVGPVSMSVLLVILNTVLLAATIAAGFVAARCLRKIRAAGDDTTGRRAEWMAKAGVINSIVFGVIIVSSYVVLATTSGCGS